MDVIRLRDEYIKLGQALKAAGLVDSGAEAKEVIVEGSVKVNGETDTRRGRKLYAGDIITFNGVEVKNEYFRSSLSFRNHKVASGSQGQGTDPFWEG